MPAAFELSRLEESIAQLLPSEGVTQDRARLLTELYGYANAAVTEARRREAARPNVSTIEQARFWLARPTFICGHHRSGTTLLRDLLDGHPELIVLPSEGTYFTSFDYVAHGNCTDRELDRFCAEWIARLIDPNFPPHFRLGLSTHEAQPYVELARAIAGWYDALRADEPRRFAPLLALVAAFHHLQPRHGTPRRWVEKTPLNERHARQLFSFADARVIQLVRDPRPTFASLRTLYARNRASHFNAAAHARAIARSLQLARDHERRFAMRYLVVRYEDLAHDPSATMTRVRGFLDVAPSDTLHTATAGGGATRPNSAFDVGAPGVVRRARDAPDLSATDSRILRAFAARAGRLWGYDLGASSWRDRLSAWRHRMLPS